MDKEDMVYGIYMCVYVCVYMYIYVCVYVYIYAVQC